MVANPGTLGRALDVLTTLGSDEAADEGGLGVVRIADLLERDKSQVSRTLKALAEHGFAERDPDTLEYRLGLRLYTLAARTGRSRLLALAPAHLSRLVEELGETAHLSILQGDEVMTLLSERSPSFVQAHDWSGHRVPADSTSSGLALRLPVNGDGPGYVTVTGQFEDGLAGAAAPVRDFRDRVVAALNVSGPEYRLGELLDAAGTLVKREADELSARLGQVKSTKEQDL